MATSSHLLNAEFRLRYISWHMKISCWGMTMLSTRPLQFCPAFRSTLYTKVREHMDGLLFQHAPVSVMAYTALPYQSLFVSWVPMGTFYILLSYILENFLHIPFVFKYKIYSTSSKSLRIKQVCFKFLSHIFSHLGAGWELHLHDTHALFMWLTTAKQLGCPR